jgi:hypothetical protein
MVVQVVFAGCGKLIAACGSQKIVGELSGIRDVTVWKETILGVNDHTANTAPNCGLAGGQKPRMQTGGGAGRNCGCATSALIRMFSFPAPLDSLVPSTS